MKNPTPSIKDDYEHCRAVIKKHSKSFYFAFSSLPETDAKAIYAIYAFCRSADVAIDHAATRAEQISNLKQLEAELDLFLAGSVPDAPMWRALQDVVCRYEIEEEMLRAQIRGQWMDVGFKQPENMEALIHYSNHVAGSVGRLLLPILCDDLSDRRRRNAESLGVAMQLTNILRDVGEDMDPHNRIYIPKTILSKYGYAARQLKNGEINRAFIDVWEHLAREAESLYDAFREEIQIYREEARLPLLMALSIYREILDEVRRNGYDCFTRRNAVAFARKMKIRNREKEFLESMKVTRGGSI